MLPLRKLPVLEKEMQNSRQRHEKKQHEEGKDVPLLKKVREDELLEEVLLEEERQEGDVKTSFPFFIKLILN